MSTPQQPNSENTGKRPAAVKIAYGIIMTALVGLLLVSAYLYWKESQPSQPAQAQTTQSGQRLESTPTTEIPDASTEPAAPAETTQPTQPVTPSDPEEPTVPAPTDPEEPAVPDPTDPEEPQKVDIRLNTHASPVYLIGQGARDYLAAEKVPDVTAFFSRYWETESRMDWGVPVELSYTVYSLPKGVTVTGAVFRLYASDGSGKYTEYEPEKGSRSVYVYNLRTGTSYRYGVALTLSDGTDMTLSGSFRTAATPRLMNIDGLVNVRDLGGWVTADGKTVKQGLLYRGSELDGTVEAEFKLTEQGLEQLKALGIRTDLDLRHQGEDVLPGAEHIYYNAIQYEYAFTPAGMEAVGRLFADLADPDNYPAYLHCTYGADRTGTMCYLLLGLLGVSDGDLKRDYELTALYYGYVSPELMDAFIDKIAALPGDTTQARVEYFLRSAGVTQEQMESIRQIFLG